MRRPSVLFINRVYPPVQGATGRLLRDLARAFAQEGWLVNVITTAPVSVQEKDGAVRVWRVKGPERPRFFVVYIWLWLKMFVAALRQPRPSLIVTLSDPPMLALAGYALGAIKRTRHIHWCHDLYPDLLPALGYRLPGWLMRGLKALSRLALRKADKVIVVGRCMARHLTYSKLDPRHITFIPNWPDLELLAPAPETDLADQGAALAGIRASSQQIQAGPRFRVLYAGNIGRGHPVDVVLDAAELLQEEHPEIEFVFVGGGPRFDALSQERGRRGLDNVRLLPFQPATRLRALMESGDVHLVTLREEAAGLMVPSKLYAALAAQRPCVFIGPSHSEAAKIIQDYKAGAVIGQRDAAALAAAVKTLRLDADAWFAAHAGAAEAGKVFVPQESLNAWIERAWAVVRPDVLSDPANRAAVKTEAAE